jgi:hypothetical protein
MAVIGIIVGLIGAAVGIVVGAVGGLVGMGVGLLGGSLALLPHLFPVLLITLGVIWLVKASSPKPVAGATTGRGELPRPHNPCSPR